QTIDIDVKLDPEPAGSFEAIAVLKNELDLNIELAAPSDFIPAPTNWRERSKHIASIGNVEFYHFDFTLQALAKLERGYEQDIVDARNFVRGGYTNAEVLTSTFAMIQPNLVRYPAIDGFSFKKKVERFLASLK
ncbi:MAG TPA: hypothetical protein VM260_24395, partial [Pirellula sp.]|nr:hypothetical protein [Pirellula sp.]